MEPPHAAMGENNRLAGSKTFFAVRIFFSEAVFLPW